MGKCKRIQFLLWSLNGRPLCSSFQLLVHVRNKFCALNFNFSSFFWVEASAAAFLTHSMSLNVENNTKMQIFQLW